MNKLIKQIDEFESNRLRIYERGLYFKRIIKLALQVKIDDNGPIHECSKLKQINECLKRRRVNKFKKAYTLMYLTIYILISSKVDLGYHFASDYKKIENDKKIKYTVGLHISSLWVSRTGSASDWCALQEALYKFIDTIQYNTMLVKVELVVSDWSFMLFMSLASCSRCRCNRYSFCCLFCSAKVLARLSIMTTEEGLEKGLTWREIG